MNLQIRKQIIEFVKSIKLIYTYTTYTYVEALSECYVDHNKTFQGSTDEHYKRNIGIPNIHCDNYVFRMCVFYFIFCVWLTNNRVDVNQK